ncbi:MAG: hypothetical protein OSJ55_08960 [Bacteroidales bacterium]|nr:hypothetical protein [Bacteroidales bacterium]
MLNRRIIAFIQGVLVSFIVFMFIAANQPWNGGGPFSIFYYVRIYIMILVALIILCANIIYEKHLTLRSLKMMDDLKVRLASFGEITELTDSRLHDYISTIEMCIILYRRRDISLNEFNSQFGYRIEQLLKLQNANDVIRRYEYLNEIVGKLKKKKLLPNV